MKEGIHCVVSAVRFPNMQVVKYKKLIDQKSVEKQKTLERMKATGPKSDAF